MIIRGASCHKEVQDAAAHLIKLVLIYSLEVGLRRLDVPVHHPARDVVDALASLGGYVCPGVAHGVGREASPGFYHAAKLIE